MLFVFSDAEQAEDGQKVGRCAADKRKVRTKSENTDSGDSGADDIGDAVEPGQKGIAVQQSVFAKDGHQQFVFGWNIDDIQKAYSQ